MDPDQASLHFGTTVDYRDGWINVTRTRAVVHNGEGDIESDTTRIREVHAQWIAGIQRQLVLWVEQVVMGDAVKNAPAGTRVALDEVTRVVAGAATVAKYLIGAWGQQTMGTGDGAHVIAESRESRNVFTVDASITDTMRTACRYWAPATDDAGSEYVGVLSESLPGQVERVQNIHDGNTYARFSTSKSVDGSAEVVEYKCQLSEGRNPRVLRVWTLQSDAPEIHEINQNFENEGDNVRLGNVKRALDSVAFDEVKLKVSGTLRRVKMLKVRRLRVDMSKSDKRFAPDPQNRPGSAIEFGWVPADPTDQQADGTIAWIEGIDEVPATGAPQTATEASPAAETAQAAAREAPAARAAPAMLRLYVDKNRQTHTSIGGGVRARSAIQKIESITRHLSALSGISQNGETAAHMAMRRRILELELRCYMIDTGIGVTCGLLDDGELTRIQQSTSGYTWNHESSPHILELHRARAAANGLDPSSLTKGVSSASRREQCIGDVEYHEQLQLTRDTIRRENADSEWATIGKFDSHTIRRTVHAMVIISAAGDDRELFIGTSKNQRKHSYIELEEHKDEKAKAAFRTAFYPTVDEEYDVSQSKAEPGYIFQGRVPTNWDLMSSFNVPDVSGSTGVKFKRLPGVDDWDATAAAIRDVLFSRAEVDRMWKSILGDADAQTGGNRAFTFIAAMIEYATRLVISWLAVYHHSFYQERVLAPLVSTAVAIDAETGMRVPQAEGADEEATGDADTAAVDKWHPRVADGVMKSIDRALRIARPLAHRPSFVCLAHADAFARRIKAYRFPWERSFLSAGVPSESATADPSLCRVFECPIHRHSISPDVAYCDDPHAHRAVQIESVESKDKEKKLSESVRSTNKEKKTCGRCKADLYLVSASIRCTGVDSIDRMDVPIGGVVYPGIMALDECWARPAKLVSGLSILEVAEADEMRVKLTRHARDTPSTLRALLQGYLNQNRINHATLRDAMDAYAAQQSDDAELFTWDPYVY